MKLLFVANVAKEHIRKFHIPTIKILISNGWEVDVACKADADVPEASRLHNMCWERSPFTFKTFRGIGQLKRLLAENHYDIVYCHTPVGGLVARFAARGFRKSGTKVVYCAHGLHFFKGAPLINWLLFYPMEKLMARWTDLFITINDEDYERICKSFNHKMRVKKINGIGANFNRLKVAQPDVVRSEYRQKLGIPTDAVTLIYIAEIIKNKNQSMLIKALKELHDRGKLYYLLLPGPNHQNGEFQRLADRYCLSEYVKFLGWKNDIGELLYSSDIYVASSIREGFGINLVEAQYCHLPVVASSNRGHRAIIKDGENGFLVKVDDYIGMADKIEYLADNRDVFDQFANIDVSFYSSENVATEIASYLNEALSL